MMCRAPCGTTGPDIHFARVPWVTARPSARGHNDARGGGAAACYLTDIVVRPHLVDFLAGLECMRQPSVEWFVYSANVSVNVVSFLERLLPMVARRRRTMSQPNDESNGCVLGSAPTLQRRRQLAWSKVLLAPFVAAEQYPPSTSSNGPPLYPNLCNEVVPKKSLSCVLLPAQCVQFVPGDTTHNNGDTGATATPKLPLEQRNCHDWFSLPVIIDDRVDVLTCDEVSMRSVFLVNPFIIDSSISDDVTFHPDGSLSASLRALHTYCAVSSSPAAATNVAWSTFWRGTGSHAYPEPDCACDPHRERRNAARTAFLSHWEEVHQQCQTRSLIDSLVSL